MLVTVVRTEARDGKRIHREPRGVSKPDGGYPLYRLTSVLANDNRPLLIVEGERTADSANDLFDEFETTTAIGGAGKASTTDWSPVSGRAVVIWPDADQAGREHADSVSEHCRKAGATRVSIVDTAGLPGGWDLADRTPEGVDIHQRVDDAPIVYRLTPEEDEIELSVFKSWDKPPRTHLWCVDGWISHGRVALIAGKGGTGKSKLVLQLAFSIASGGKRWFPDGPEVAQHGNVVFASWEDDYEEFTRRLLDNPSMPDYNPIDTLKVQIENKLHLADMATFGALWAADKASLNDTQGVLTPSGAALRKYCLEVEAKLLIIDPLAAAFGLNENNRGAVRDFVASWDGWGRKHGCTTLIIAHPPKGGAQFSGSTDWQAAPRSVLFMERDEEDRTRLWADKVSYGARPSPIELESWKWWHARPDTGTSEK